MVKIRSGVLPAMRSTSLLKAIWIVAIVGAMATVVMMSKRGREWHVCAKLSGCRTRLVAKAQKSSGGLRILEWAGKGGLLPQPVLVSTAKTGWREIWKIMMRELAPQSADGQYIRPGYTLRSKIGTPQHPQKSGRYRLYVGNACPWCHRALLVKAVRGIKFDSLPHTSLIDDPTKASRGGWAFGSSEETRDPLFNCRDLRQLYEKLMPGYSGRCTAPLMVDCKTQTIVSNESEDIVRMLNDFDLLDENQTQDDTHPLIVDLYPPQLRNQIDTANEWIYKSINNGVYRCGFSTSQEGYDRAIKDVTQGLDKLEEMLSKSRFLLGDKVTESDIRLLPTMARFDSVYNPFFKCTTRTIKSMPNIQGWLQDMYQIPGVPETLDLDDAIRSYYSNLFPLNPSGIVAKGPPFNTTDPKRGSHVKQDLFYDKAERSSSSSP